MDNKSIQRQIDAAKARVRRMKNAAPYMFNEWHELNRAKDDLNRAKQRLEKARAVWKAVGS